MKESKIIAMELSIKALNEDFAYFRFGEHFSGFIHKTGNGCATIILDGGYLLGVYESADEALKGIAALGANILMAELKAGVSFSTYKSAYWPKNHNVH
ncbi:hypothetical protein NLT11_001466 [Cronobacter sakazakii]|uniref:hypothetical protein n=1 Tax=Cronobacter sakazakii TaxID=28141 RepID=UPI0003A23839|nr:hypothetical protein [Cronobacter sakazakii]EGT4258610.1 hypothetical protein [Cronobacter sakazakii]EGT4269643.1 hypothetical protein [Cronobacter sakazakii]EGT4300537.1 hypothetical protein [Cronobacter sakazakii]EGT4317339.1 hypothetical protein [Cronobacter sakazakii]EGT4341727.1 hypothetical protein [Cronobacter sakazakii]